MTMTPAKINPVVRLLPSLTDFAFLMPVLLLFTAGGGVQSLLSDGDTGWHLRAGEWMLANGQVLRHDIFSFTKAGEPWYAWEWLWDVSFGWLHARWGMAAVLWLSLLILCATSALLFRVSRRRSGDPFCAIAATLLAVVASAIHWLARPHLVTLLFTIVFLWLLQRAESRWRLLALLPALTLVWANLHGGFFVGLLILGAYTAGEVLRWFMAAGATARRDALLAARRYGITALSCAVFSLVNPFGYKLHAHIFAYLSDSYHRDNIVEFQSINFHNSGAVFFESLLLLAALAAFSAARRKDFSTALLLVGWGHLALYSGRNIPLFAIIAAPAVAQTLAEGLRVLRTSGPVERLRRAAVSAAAAAAEFQAIDRIRRVHAVSASVVILLGMAMASPGASGKLSSEYDSKRYPVAALARLGPELQSNRVFTDDEWGDYLIYRLFPNAAVFIDGRSDFYGGDFGRKYFDVMNVKHGWEDYLRRFHVQTILLSTSTAFAGALKQSPRWRIVYDDGVAIVFRAAPSVPHTQVSAVSAARKKGDPELSRGNRAPSGSSQSNERRTQL